MLEAEQWLGWASVESLIIIGYIARRWRHMRWIVWWMVSCGLLAGSGLSAADEQSYRWATPGPWIIDPVSIEPAAATADGEALRWWLIDSRSGLVDNDHKHYLHLAATVTSASGLSQLAQQQITFQPDYQKVVLHRLGLWRDGQWSDRQQQTTLTMAAVEEQFDQGMTTGMSKLLLVVPDVRVGDLVEFSYSVEGSNPILAGVQGGSLQLATVEANERLRVEVIRDPQRQVHLAMSGPNAGAIPKWQPAGAYEHVVIDLHPVPVVPLQDAVPPEHLQVPTLEFSEAADWSAVNAWAQELFQIAPDDPTLKAQLDELRRIKDPEQQILSTLRFVQRDVRYFARLLGENSHRPHPLAQILEQRLGDCKDKTLLLTSLLRGLGYQAYPALYSTESEGAVLQQLARGTVFDHAIVALDYSGQRYWLDPTLTIQRGKLDELGFYSLGAALLVGGPDSGPVVTAPASEQPATVDLTEQLVLAADGSGELLMRFEYGREMAEIQRDRIDARGQRQLEQGYRDYYARRFGAIAEAQPADFQLDQPGNRVRVEQRFKLKSPTRSPGSGSVVRIENSALADLFAAPVVVDRDAPWRQIYPLELRYRFELTLAPEQQLRATLPPMTVDAPGFSFQQSVERSGNSVIFSQVARSLSRSVAAADVPQYSRALKRVYEHVGYDLSLAGTKSDDDERRQRLRKLLQGD